MRSAAAADIFIRREEPWSHSQVMQTCNSSSSQPIVGIAITNTASRTTHSSQIPNCLFRCISWILRRVPNLVRTVFWSAFSSQESLKFMNLTHIVRATRLSFRRLSVIFFFILLLFCRLAMWLTVNAIFVGHIWRVQSHWNCHVKVYSIKINSILVLLSFIYKWILPYKI